MANYLFVVAHLDDEILGGGASIYELAKNGHNVDVCILTFQHKDRNHGDVETMFNQMKKSHKILGVNHAYLGFFPNAKLNTVVQSEIVAYIEKAISQSKPDYIFCHSFSDLNLDHHMASLTAQVASRYNQRQIFGDDETKIRAVYFMEIQSSTDWHINKSVNQFNPDTFVEVSQEALNAKVRAIKCYDDVVRPLPHPKAEKSIKALAVLRGTQSGFEYAEAFQTGFNFIGKNDLLWQKNKKKEFK